MAGKTISAYTDAETASRIADVAKLEHRTQAKIAGLALKFFVGLPAEARAALWQISALGNEADWEEISCSITRTLLNAQYKVAHRQLLEQIKVDHLEPLETENEILAAAVVLTGET
jgi:hypothetical protein